MADLTNLLDAQIREAEFYRNAIPSGVANLSASLARLGDVRRSEAAREQSRQDQLANIGYNRALNERLSAEEKSRYSAATAFDREKFLESKRHAQAMEGLYGTAGADKVKEDEGVKDNLLTLLGQSVPTYDKAFKEYKDSTDELDNISNTLEGSGKYVLDKKTKQLVLSPSVIESVGKENTGKRGHWFLPEWTVRDIEGSKAKSQAGFDEQLKRANEALVTASNRKMKAEANLAEIESGMNSVLKTADRYGLKTDLKTGIVTDIKTGRAHNLSMERKPLGSIATAASDGIQNVPSIGPVGAETPPGFTFDRGVQALTPAPGEKTFPRVVNGKAYDIPKSVHNDAAMKAATDPRTGQRITDPTVIQDRYNQIIEGYVAGGRLPLSAPVPSRPYRGAYSGQVPSF